MYDVDLRRPIALLLGSEGRGLDARLVERSDHPHLDTDERAGRIAQRRRGRRGTRVRSPPPTLTRRLTSPIAMC